ncbi:MAG: hypothetical protein KAS32_19530 [Candidatus Peribacteraceae bacterium]|nr:hypothetical protein [Candidatus Peribacteraceae bacterium]
MKKRFFITEEAQVEWVDIGGLIRPLPQWVEVPFELGKPFPIPTETVIKVASTTTPRQISEGELSLSISYEPTFTKDQIEEEFLNLLMAELWSGPSIPTWKDWFINEDLLAPWNEIEFDSDTIHYPWLNTHFFFNNTLWLPCSHPKIISNSFLLHTKCESEKCQARRKDKLPSNPWAIKRNICDGWNIPYTEKNYSNPCIYGFKKMKKRFWITEGSYKELYLSVNYKPSELKKYAKRRGISLDEAIGYLEDIQKSINAPSTPEYITFKFSVVE